MLLTFNEQERLEAGWRKPYWGVYFLVLIVGMFVAAYFIGGSPTLWAIAMLVVTAAYLAWTTYLADKRRKQQT